MSFLFPKQIAELAKFASVADMEARSDLSAGFIRDEDDYSSNFTGALRRIINTSSQTGLTATSFMLTPAEERQYGADAAIVLTRGDESKVAIFEAKWPRFSKAGHAWDYSQTATGLSHFSDQIERQKSWHPGFAVFEMFYCEYPFFSQPPFLRDKLSSCVWHEDAESFRSKRPRPDRIWSHADLQSLLSAASTDIAEVIRQLGECLKGNPRSISDPLVLAREFHLPPNILSIRAAAE